MADGQEKKGLKSAMDRQKEVYVRGAAGFQNAIPFDFDELESRALSSMSKAGFDYVKTGAGREETVHNNRHAFQQYRVTPRVLRDVSQCETKTQILDLHLPSPMMLAPIGVLDLASKEGDLKAARACEQTGVPMIFSNQASQPMESCSRLMTDTPKWMQIYWSKNEELVRSFFKRAESCGCSAIVLTLDTTLLGWRLRDLNNAYLPFLEGRGIAQYTSDPVFNDLLKNFYPPKEKPQIGWKTFKTLFQLAKNYPGSTIQNLFSDVPLKSVRQFISIYSQPKLNWAHVEKALEWTNLPIVLKGVMHPEDALKAHEMGVSGLIVSNHGGRQVDGARSSLDALIDIRSAIGPSFPLLLDSGIRGGQDIFKALALGADAVLIGRPYVYALALGGQEGVEELLQNYHAEFELTMALSGCRSINEVKSMPLERK